MKSDAELFAAAIAGGPEAFVPIVERYQDAVFGIALARLRNFHDAEDVGQGRKRTHRTKKSIRQKS